MADAMAPHVGRETVLPGGGRTWRISRLERRHWAEFFNWAKTVLPDPLKVAQEQIERLALRALEIEELYKGDDKKKNALLAANLRQQKQAQAEAQDKATGYLQVGSAQTNSLLNSVEGAAQMLTVLLQQHHPGATADDAYAIMEENGDRIQEVFARANGKAPSKNA